MIDVPALASKLVAQDEALRQNFADLIDAMPDGEPGRVLVEVVAKGLAAIHERQGDHIILMLQTNQ